jgi:hypothetical protein
LESGARAALAAAKEAVAEASGFAKKSRAFLLIERLIFVTSRLFCLERPCWNKAAFFESRGGFLARGQQSRGGFQKTRQRRAALTAESGFNNGERL